MRTAACGAACTISLLSAASALAFDPEREQQNYQKTTERDRYIVKTPEFQARLAQQEAQDNVDLAQIAAAEAPALATQDQRNFAGNVCSNRKRECAGDVRFYDWEATVPGAIVEPVLFTGRSGATLSGTVWATEAGPATRPAIVITTGSVQAPETLYWGLAAFLAQRGYVVLTYDVQGQGRSDTFGEDDDEGEGVPAQQAPNFLDGTEDALDFMLSTPAGPYLPRASCTSGTSHAERHLSRVGLGLNAAFNPLHGLVDPSRIGVAGHSLGASSVSYIGQKDPRIDAIVAWDNLSNTNSKGSCDSAPESRADTAITKPALGISNDYGLTPTPMTADPANPLSKSTAFDLYKTAGVDSMQVNIRGGTHFESSFIPGQTVPSFGQATLRGYDAVAWYTGAWFDKYVRCQGDPGCAAEAERELLTTRWQSDQRNGEVDAAGDPNLYSFYFPSRYDFTTNAGKVVCDDMRAGCPSMAPDGGPANFSLLGSAFAAPGAGGGGAGGGGSAAGGKPCALAQGGGPQRDTLIGTDAGDALRGGGGDDRLRGGGGDDCLFGQAGEDRLNGGPGHDKLKGGTGNDRLKATDGEPDKVYCGGGTKDRATIDRRGDRTRGCETIRKRRS